MNRIKVNLDKRLSRSYDICIGQDILDRAGLLLAKNNWAARYIIVTDAHVEALHGARVLETLRGVGLKADLIAVPAGEGSKVMDTALKVVDRLMDLGADRSSALIALGGGVIGDLAGFIASIYMRSVPCIQIPTTLLAQVDSSIGGKTGIDLPAGKNLLGTFSQPKAVFIDLSFLQTLPPREFGNGLAEIVKYGVIEDPELLDLLEKKGEDVSGDPGLLESLIARACRIKKGIVEMDETEKGLRRILNFGHTVGHAVEAESAYALSHGEGVAIGMTAAAMISERLKYLPPGDRERIATLVRALHLPERIPAGMSADGLLSRMRKDKKKEGDTVHFVLLKKVGMPFVNGGVPEGLVREVIEDLKR